MITLKEMSMVGSMGASNAPMQFSTKKKKVKENSITDRTYYCPYCHEKLEKYKEKDSKTGKELDLVRCPKHGHMAYGDARLSKPKKKIKEEKEDIECTVCGRTDFDDIRQAREHVKNKHGYANTDYFIQKWPGNKNMKEQLSLTKAMNQALYEVDLSKVPKTVASWLGKHFAEINKIYTDKSKLVDYLQNMRRDDEVSVSDDYFENFIDKIKSMNNPKAALSYCYDCYLKGAGLGVK